jgi:hypothetical protein
MATFQIPGSIPDSNSEVLRATHILQLQVASATFEAWDHDEGGGLAGRWVELNLKLLNVLKGMTAQQVGDTLPVAVWQLSMDGRVGDDPGVWSQVELAPEVQLLAFCVGATTDIRTLLQAEHCELLLPPEAARETRAALALDHLSAPRVLAEAAIQLETGGDLLARYVWARVRGAVLVNDDLFEVLIQLLERPATSGLVRDGLLSAINDEFALSTAVSLRAKLLLAHAMLSVALLPDAMQLGHVLQVFLPNLIGLQRRQADISSTQVLPDPDARTRMVTALQTNSALDPEGELTDWLLT